MCGVFVHQTLSWKSGEASQCNQSFYRSRAMARPFHPIPWPAVLGAALLFPALSLAAPGAEFATTKEGIVGTYRKIVPEEDFGTVKARDEKDKPRVAARQKSLLDERYDLSDRPSSIKMSGGRRAVQE